MKKLLAVLLVALMLTGVALSVSADPIDVGGDYCSSAAFVPIWPVKGPIGFSLCCGPIDVGGD
jgi:hypothetical protein